MGFPGGAVKNPACPCKRRKGSIPGWEDHLEKEMATSIPIWKTPWTEELWGLQSVGWQRVGYG